MSFGQIFGWCLKYSIIVSVFQTMGRWSRKTRKNSEGLRKTRKNSEGRRKMAHASKYDPSIALGDSYGSHVIKWTPNECLVVILEHKSRKLVKKTRKKTRKNS